MKKFTVSRCQIDGQSLVEVVLALGVVMLVCLVLIRMVVVSLSNANYAKYQSLSTRYTQEVIEKVRAYKDRYGWQGFTQDCSLGTIPLDTLPAPFGTPVLECYLPDQPGINCDVGQSRCEVRVMINWVDAKGNHGSELKTIFTDW